MAAQAKRARFANARGLGIYYEELFEIHPCPTLVVGGSASLRDFNRAAFSLIQRELDQVVGLLIGDVMRCANAVGSPGGCGTSPDCHACGVRNFATDTIKTGTAHKATVTMTFLRDETSSKATFDICTVPLRDGDDTLAVVTVQSAKESV